MADRKIGYVDLRDGIVTILQTALGTGVNIYTGDIRKVPIPAGAYPAVVVNHLRSTEEFSNLGAGRKRASVFFAIYSLAHVTSSNSGAGNSMLNLVDNVESALRNNVSLSSTVHFTQIETSFEEGDLNGTYVSAGITLLECVKEVKDAT